MISPGFHWRHLETCWSMHKTNVSIRYIQWYLLQSAGDTWRLAGAFARHMLMFATSNDPSWIPLETPGDMLETCRDIHEVRNIQWYLLDSAGDTWRPAGDVQRHTTRFATSNNTSWILLETPGDLLETSRDIPQGLQHPMIPHGFCWRHLETHRSHCKTYVDIRYIQWYLLDSAGDTWRPAGDIQRHTTRFMTSNDPSWILLETPGDLLERSRDIPQASRHPMIPPGFCWRHLEMCWSLAKTHVDISYIQSCLLHSTRDLETRCKHPEAYHEVCDIQSYLLDCAGDTWRPAGDVQRHTTRFATSNDTSWILVQTCGDLLEPSQDICWHSLHPMIPPGFHWRHPETCWRHPDMYHEVRDIEWYLLDSAGDTWRPAGDVQTYHEVHGIHWYLLDSTGDTWRLTGAFARHKSMFATSNDTSWILLETPGDSLEPSQDIWQCLLHPMICPGFRWRHLDTCWRWPEMYHEVCDIQWYLLDSAGDLLSGFTNFSIPISGNPTRGARRMTIVAEKPSAPQRKAPHSHLRQSLIDV